MLFITLKLINTVELPLSLTFRSPSIDLKLHIEYRRIKSEVNCNMLCVEMGLTIKERLNILKEINCETNQEVKQKKISNCYVKVGFMIEKIKNIFKSIDGSTIFLSS